MRIFSRVSAELLNKLLCHVIDQSTTPVETAKHHISVGREDAEIRWRIPDDRHVESTTAEVVHQNRLLFLVDVRSTEFHLLPGIRERRGGRFVDDVDDIQTGDAPRILCGLTTHVIEVVRHRDDSIRDGPDVLFSVLFHLFENQGRDEFRRQLLVLIDNI